MFKGAVCSISHLHQTVEALISRLITEQIIHPHRHQTENSDQSITLFFVFYVYFSDSLFLYLLHLPVVG